MVGESAFARAERLARSSARWARGVEGLVTADSLADLTRDEWIVLDDFAWSGREGVTIDHVVVGPPGVFVIDTNRWKGRITTVGGILMHNGRSKASTTHDARAAAESVAELLPSRSRPRVVPVLCFKKGDVPNGTIDGVLVCSITTIVHHLIARPVVLAPDQVRAAVHELRRGAATHQAEFGRADPTEGSRKRGLLARLPS